MLLSFLIAILGVWLFFLHVCLCTVCMPDAHGGQRRALDLLKLELQMVVNHCVGARNKTQIL